MSAALAQVAAAMSRIKQYSILMVESGSKDDYPRLTGNDDWLNINQRIKFIATGR
jgi:hypothetical protein